MTEMQKYSITYQKMRVQVSYPRPIRAGKCMACKRKIGNEIKTTQMHHTKYVHSKKAVKKNPLLALDNALELCFFDHVTADGFRSLLLSHPSGSLKHPRIIMRTAKLLPSEQLARLELFCKMFLKWRKKVTVVNI